MNPYIGITDFMDFNQVQAMFAIFRVHLPPGSNRKLHVGVMTSYKKLHDIPSRWQNAFPAKEKFADIFASDEVYNCLHYADYDNNPELWKSLVDAISLSGAGINALQLDMIWPDADEIARAIYRFPRQKIEVILQVGKNALDQVGNEPAAVVSKLKNYEGVIHRVLLDKSMGRGLGMDAEGLIPFAAAIKEKFPRVGIGAAGGLGPTTIQLVEPLVKVFPDLSIDAQGKLRPSGNALNPIDWSMASEYLVKAIQLFA